MSRENGFSPITIKSIKSQSAFICSNPECRVLTIAPSIKDEMEVQYTGSVAHITAASKGGARYDPDNVKCAEIDNAIFLCSNCATMIDKNGGIDYSVETLNKWKHDHLTWVRSNLNKNPFSKPDSAFVSNNQSGGISANIVNVYSPFPDENNKLLEHDKTIFNLGCEILDDSKILEIYNRLKDYGECKVSQQDSLDLFREFLEKIENSFLIPEIENTKKEIILSIRNLSEYITKFFDKYPISQRDDDFRIQLQPKLLRDSPYEQKPTMDHKKWHEIHDELVLILDSFKSSYNKYRLEVKRCLFI